MLRAILFDFGDTLIDFEPMDTRGVFREAARETHRFLLDAGFTPPALEAYCRRQFRAVRWAYLWAKLRRRDFNALDLLRSFCQRIGIPLTEPQLRELAWLWYEPLTRLSGSEEGLVDTLALLRQRGLKLAIVSNTFVDGHIHDRHLAMHGLLDFFPVRIYSSEVGVRKPNPQIFHAALDRLGVEPAEAMFVGDLVKTDIVGARNVGMTTVLKRPWGASRAAARADFVVTKLAELPHLIEAEVRRRGDVTTELMLQPA